MTTRTRVKVCGITREEDAVYAAQCGVDALGLVFYAPSKRAVDAVQAQRIVAAVPAFVTVTGLFVDAGEAEVERVLQLTRLDLLQFHGDESPEFCRRWDRRYMKAVRVRAADDVLRALESYHDAAALLLDTWVDGVPGGTGQVFDWSMIPSGVSGPLVLAGGLNSANVRRAVQTVRPWAVDVSGGVESAPGVKDPERIKAFLEEVRKADETD